MRARARDRLLKAALEIQEFCTRRRWPFCFMGGMAVQHWGEPRLTRDADLTLYTGIGDEETFVDSFVFKVFAGRPLDWADVEGVVAKSGKRIDWADVRSDLRELLALKQDGESLPRLEKVLAGYGY